MCSPEKTVEWLKILTGVGVTVVSVVFCRVLFIVWTFSGITYTEVLQSVNSPDNTYNAQTILLDSGALGGETEVRVSNLKSNIKLLTGTISPCVEVVWQGSWADKPEVVWIDDCSLSVDGTVYNIK